MLLAVIVVVLVVLYFQHHPQGQEMLRLGREAGWRPWVTLSWLLALVVAIVLIRFAW